MNKAITDGVDLMPRRFGEGLDVWSNQDGTPGSTTYDGQCTAAIVPSDSDFGTCLELGAKRGVLARHRPGGPDHDVGIGGARHHEGKSQTGKDGLLHG